MDQSNMEQSVKQEHGKYSEFINKIILAFTAKCKSLFTEFKTRQDRAILAEDHEHAEQILSEYKEEIKKISEELKQTLEDNDKRFLRHIEKFVSRIEQAQTLKDLENQLNTL